VSGLKFGATGVPTKAFLLFDKIKSLKEVIKILSGLKRFIKKGVSKKSVTCTKTCYYKKYNI